MDNSTVLVLADPTEKELALLENLPDGTSLAVGLEPAAFERLAPEADVILSWSGKGDVLEKVFALTPKVKWVHSRSAGLDAVLFPALISSPVVLTNGKGVFSQSLGEFALGAILYFAKDFPRMRRNQLAGQWEQFDVDEISTQTVGIVGYGSIGHACAWRCKAMGMKVLALRRRPELSSADPIVDELHPMAALHEVLPRCDYVIVAAPLTPESRHLMSDAAFKSMKRGSVLVNVGRGPVVDEAALIRALESSHLRGAGLDVFETEPLAAGHAFYHMENVLLSPHCADHTRTWLMDAMQFFVDNFGRYKRGEPLENVVEKRMGY